MFPFEWLRQEQSLRNLEREVGNLCRKVARKLVADAAVTAAMAALLGSAMIPRSQDSLAMAIERHHADDAVERPWAVTSGVLFGQLVVARNRKWNGKAHWVVPGRYIGEDRHGWWIFQGTNEFCSRPGAASCT